MQIGEMLLSENLVTPEQLAKALEEQRERPYQRVGEVLVRLGAIDFHQLDEQLERQQRATRLGEILVRRGLLSCDQLEVALSEHRATGLLLGHLVVKLGFCTIDQVIRVLDEQRLKVAG